MSSSDLVEVVHSLQTQLSQRGAGAFRTLQMAFDINDKDKNGTFDFQEIEAILAKAGLFLKVRTQTRRTDNEIRLGAANRAGLLRFPPLASGRDSLRFELRGREERAQKGRSEGANRAGDATK